MCGIVGVASNGPMSLQMKDFFQSLLYHDIVRGAHATGIAAIDTQTRALAVEKRALPADEFLKEKETQENLFASKHNFNIYIGHNRYATMGDKALDKNAHPFIHGDIVGVHNGSLRDQSKLDDNEKFVVDSDNLYYHLSRNGLDETIKVTNGAFALVWYDRKDNTLNFIRNEERPLCIAKLSNGCYVWASEAGMLRWLVGRHKFLRFETEKREGVDTQLIFNLEKGIHLKVPFKDGGRAHEKPGVAEKTLPTFPVSTSGYGKYSSWDNPYTVCNDSRTQFQLEQDKVAQQWISANSTSDSTLELLFEGKRTVTSPSGVNQSVSIFKFVNHRGETLLFHSYSGQLSVTDAGTMVYAKIGGLTKPNAYTPIQLICGTTKLVLSVFSCSKTRPGNTSIYSYWTDKMLSAKEAEVLKKRQQSSSQEGAQDVYSGNKVTNLEADVPFANMKWKNTKIRKLFEENKYSCANCGNTLSKARIGSIYILQHYDILEAEHNDYICCSEKCFTSLSVFFDEADEKDIDTINKQLLLTAE